MRKNTRSFGVLLFIFAATIFNQSEVLAHTLRIFATPDGEQIKGYCFMSGGSRLEGVKVDVKDAEGKPVFAIFTDKNGEFAFKPSALSDYTFHVDSGDGHAAECKVSSAELKGLVPAGTVADAKARDDDSEPGPDAAGDDAPSSYTVSADDMVIIDDIRKVVAEEVSSQIAPLREQLDAYQNKIHFSDIIAGIGYILGIAGITFYLLATRNRQQ